MEAGKEKHMEELIKRMEQDGKNTAIIKLWYSEFLNAVNFCKNLCNNGCIFSSTNEYEDSKRSYENMRGFIRGLYTVDYISDETCDSIINELIEMQNF